MATDVGRRTAEDIGLDVLRIAADFYEAKPSWVTFYREVFGLEGIIAQSFPEPASRAAFEQTSTYTRLSEMLARLREATDEWGGEPLRVITVRVPKSLHEALKREADQHRTSLNKLCITKLLVPLALAVKG